MLGALAAWLIGAVAPAAAQEADSDQVNTPPAPLTTVDAIFSDGVADSLIEQPYRLGEEQVTLTLQSGESLSALFERAGVPRADWYTVADALDEHMDLRRLRPGHEFTLTLTHMGLDSALTALETLPDVETVVRVERDPTEGSYLADTLPNALTAETIAAEGRITHSLFANAAEAGIPDAVIMTAIRQLSFSIDFQRDIQPNDGFAMLFEREYFADGSFARNGDILYMRLELSGTEMELYRYEDSDGVVDYYDDTGESQRRLLMRTPIDGARMSSGFGMRHHPILGYSRMHRGVDFAAPTGTPIYAAGNGTIDFIGTNSGYGRYIRIRHNSSISTAYAHMSRFATGLNGGDRVTQGQVIGYVGTSGLSTGPHLHYEVLENGTQINPMSLDLPTGRTLEGRELDQFLAEVERIDEAYQLALGDGAAVDTGEVAATSE
jgi:murein DD-endopeptidase MepM/ murein hydrolase activator NlpD